MKKDDISVKERESDAPAEEVETATLGEQITESEPEANENKKKKVKKQMPLGWKIAICVLSGVIFLLGVGFIGLSVWYLRTFNVDFKELLYTLTSPIQGTGQSTVGDIARAVLPWVIVAAVPLVAVQILLMMGKKPVFAVLRRVGVGICAAVFLFSAVFTAYSFRIPAYLFGLGEQTLIYDEYYVDPLDVAITADGETKNLIYIYLESMETTYASTEDGGAQTDRNYIPNLTELARENLTFTDKDAGQLGGFSSVPGTTWTIGSLLATTSGVPFAFPLGEGGNNDMSKFKYFAPGMTNLGDVLEEKGYVQEFLCGSDAVFGGRKNYFEQHGNYKIFDLFTAREEGYIPEDYYVWWGFEDRILFDIAKDEVTKLASGSEPFNFTMLTVDAHHVDGYMCSECERTYDNKLKNVLTCTDKLVYEFVEWCSQQPFYEDTVIVITGDHPRMDTNMVKGTEYRYRTIYNCIINSDTTPAEGATVNRTYSAVDMFPTTLAAMGFRIEGNRLGLGVNMFSGEKTLPESMGYYNFTDEVNKYSAFYVAKFM